MANVTVHIESRGDIESAREFIASIFDLRREVDNAKLWYRGHRSEKYRLIPSIGREHRYLGRTLTFDDDREWKLLHRFRRRAYPLLGRVITAGEAIFLARHHGLPTRLLDWTANALFALYFACEEVCKETDADDDGKVWALLPRRDSAHLDTFKIAKIKEEKELFEFPPRDSSNGAVLKILHPFYNSPRLLAQDGAFTWHSNPRKAVEEYEGSLFAPECLDIARLYWWRVPKACKVAIMEELSGLGITRRSLFPDLDGIAASLWETEVLWHHDTGRPEDRKDSTEPGVLQDVMR